MPYIFQLSPFTFTLENTESHLTIFGNWYELAQTRLHVFVISISYV